MFPYSKFWSPLQRCPRPFTRSVCRSGSSNRSSMYQCASPTRTSDACCKSGIPSLYGLGCCVVLLVFLCRVYDSLGFKNSSRQRSTWLAQRALDGMKVDSLACSHRRCGESPSAKLQRRVSSEDCRTPVRGQAVKLSAEMRSAFHSPNDVAGESPRVKFQRVSSEDCRTPFRGQTVKQNAEIRFAFFAAAQMLIFHIFNSVHPFSCRGHGVRDSRNLGKRVVRLFVSSSSESHVSGCRNDHWCRV